MQKLYVLFVRVASGLQSPFLAIIRLYWGWQIAQNGWGKLHNLARVTEFFASLNLPAPGPTATFVATFEFLGGILLAIGLLSRIALPLIADSIITVLDAMARIIGRARKFATGNDVVPIHHRRTRTPPALTRLARWPQSQERPARHRPLSH